MRKFTFVSVALSSAVSFLVGVILAGGGTAARIAGGAPASPPAQRERVRAVFAPGSAGTSVNFADVAEQINPAVVNIDAASRAGHRRSDDAADAPRDFDVPHQGSGSGFVIDPKGFLLTNYHVIQDADRITVTFADGRTLRADVVGSDPAIDVALLHVNGVSNLPQASIGDSDDLRVGEWVCAIGNPLGYVHSVTVGVVSFIGRKLFDASLDDYIQTDAAINFGNSGGPLINARGQVIGINSAISSRASNIGFAVPINQAIAILPQLKARGKVSRGFIGVALTDVTADLQRSLHLEVSRGALVQDVTANSPAERAGLRPYDVILSVDGHDVWTNEELIRDISARQPGSTARLDVVRDGRHLPTPVRLTERPPRDGETGDATAQLGAHAAAPVVVPDEPLLGLTVRDLDAGFSKRLEIPGSVHGVVVTRVDPAGASFVPAMRRGFIVMEINRRLVRSTADFEQMLAAARPGETLAFYGYDPTQAQRTLVIATVDDSR
jgi:serine protease Do